MIHLQFHQVLNLFLLLLLAGTMDLLYLEWGLIVLVLVGSFLIEHLFISLKTFPPKYISFSSLASAMGVMLMMVSAYWYVYFVVMILGLAQKHFLHYQGYHFFNPSNFAVVMALLFFYDEAHIVSGQLGDTGWLALAVIVLGFLTLWRAKRWIIPIVFLGGYVAFQSLLVMGYDPVLTMDEVTHRFYSVSFIVFILFMLTDPRTTPDHCYQQVLFALLIALVSSLLDRYIGFRVQHLFLVLFFFSLFIPLVKSWGNNEELKGSIITTLLLAILAIGVIIIIESQPPYYFDMNG